MPLYALRWGAWRPGGGATRPGEFPIRIRPEVLRHPEYLRASTRCRWPAACGSPATRFPRRAGAAHRCCQRRLSSLPSARAGRAAQRRAPQRGVLGGAAGVVAPQGRVHVLSADSTSVKRGHCTKSARAKNAATTPIPVQLSAYVNLLIPPMQEINQGSGIRCADPMSSPRPRRETAGPGGRIVPAPRHADGPRPSAR